MNIELRARSGLAAMSANLNVSAHRSQLLANQNSDTYFGIVLKTEYWIAVDFVVIALQTWQWRKRGWGGGGGGVPGRDRELLVFFICTLQPFNLVLEPELTIK